MLAQDVRTQIEAKGSLKHENNWGLRKMAYEIDKRNEADYRWFRFEALSELLDDLGHSLRIADGVLRFRIFKVDPDSPVMIPPAAAAPVHGGLARPRSRSAGWPQKCDGSRRHRRRGRPRGCRRRAQVSRAGCSRPLSTSRPQPSSSPHRARKRSIVVAP